MAIYRSLRIVITRDRLSSDLPAIFTIKLKIDSLAKTAHSQ